jgi:phenylacetate-CoA ligase
MLEPLVRANLHRWQTVYDRLPSPARNLVTSARGWFLSRIRYAPRTFEILRELRAHESWTSEHIAASQLNALQKTIDRARATVPFYSAYSQVQLRSLNDLRRLPVLRRETVKQNQERLIAATIPPRQLIRAGTTGTTGSNLQVAYTEDVARENWAFLLRQWSWMGVEPREPRVTLCGSRIVPADRPKPPYWTYNAPERQVLMSIFHLSVQTAPDYLDFLQTQQGKVLEGFPSVLGILADFALLCGVQIPMRVVFTSGEPLYPDVRQKIEQAFHARVFDSYGMTEFCGLIQECERGTMHLISDYGFLEILDENDEPAGPEDEGHFVWTSFINSAMPLIRYRIGDRGRWLHDGPCACGRAFPIVVPTITRESDVLHCPDGRLFSPRALNQLLKQSNSLRFCQFVHDQRARVVVRAVASNGHAMDEMMQIRAGLQELLGPGMEVTAGLATEPLAGPGGKIPLIVNQSPADRAAADQLLVNQADP